MTFTPSRFFSRFRLQYTHTHTHLHITHIHFTYTYISSFFLGFSIRLYRFRSGPDRQNNDPDRGSRIIDSKMIRIANRDSNYNSNHGSQII